MTYTRARRPGDREAEALPFTATRSAAPPGIEALRALQQGAGNAAVTRMLQRYKYETHGETLTYSDNIKDAGPYDASAAPNIQLKDPGTAGRPQAERVYESAQTGDVTYLHDTLEESPKVIGVAQRILDEVAKSKNAGTTSFMLGVVETLDGEIRAGASGASQPGAMTDAIRTLSQLHAKAVKALATPEEDRSREERETIAKDPGDRITSFPREYRGLEPEFGHMTPQKHAKKEDQGTNVIQGHVNCAAPQLLAGQLTKVQTQDLHFHLETAALDVKNMTEIYWGRDEYGVMVNGVRYHHRQTVPSCKLCEQNLKVVVYKALRDAINAQLEDSPTARLRSVEDDPGTASGSDAIRERRAKRILLEGTRRWDALITDAESALAHPETEGLIAETVTPVREAYDAGIKSAELAVWTDSWHPEDFMISFIDTTFERILEAIDPALKRLQDVRHPKSGGRAPQPQQAIPEAIQKLQQLKTLAP